MRFIPLNKSIAFRVGLIGITIIVVAVVSAWISYRAVERVGDDLARVDLTGRNRRSSHQLLYLASRRFEESNSARRMEIDQSIRELAADSESRIELLRRGNSRYGLVPVTKPEMIANLDRRAARWTEISPLIETVMGAGSREVVAAELDQLDRLLSSQSEDANNANEMSIDDAEVRVANAQNAQLTSSSVTILLILVVGAITWGLVRRIGKLVLNAENVARGDLETEIAVDGEDELGRLSDSLQQMKQSLQDKIELESRQRGQLERLVDTVSETVASISAAASEILAATSQQASGAQEQVAAVSQTVSTVDQVLQTSEQAAERAHTVSSSSQRSLTVSRSGREAVEKTVAMMSGIRSKSEVMAKTIVTLAEQAGAINEITDTVNEIAEQTNLLALNASIEASRAGEYGKGFTVVASEIKSLAAQAKQATHQVRSILREIQSAAATAIREAEEGVEHVAESVEIVNRAGETIRSLADIIAESAESAAQIAASAGQQSTGMSQIHQAMRNISEVTNQTLASSRQSERAAKDLNDLAGRLKDMVA